MAHTSALYYPWIEVQEEDWVKTALLYWERLYTIMPASQGDRYRTPLCEELQAAGVLEPVVVHPAHEDVADCTDAALDYLTNPALARTAGTTAMANMSPDKLADQLMRAGLFDIHPDKLDSQVARALAERVGPDDFISVERGFAEYYMATLAARVSARMGLATVTPSDPHQEVVTRAHLRGPGNRHLLDEPLPMMMRRRRWPRLSRPDRRNYGEGILATVVLQGAAVGASTPLRDVLRFRERHEAELGVLRTALAGYSDRFVAVADDEAMWQLANDIFQNELRPLLVQLEARLREAPIHLAVNAIKAAVLTSLGGGVLATALGATFIGPVAVPAVAGLSVVLTAVQHDREQAAARRGHPMSYVLAAQRRFHG